MALKKLEGFFTWSETKHKPTDSSDRCDCLWHNKETISKRVPLLGFAKHITFIQKALAVVL